MKRRLLRGGGGVDRRHWRRGKRRRRRTYGSTTGFSRPLLLLLFHSFLSSRIRRTTTSTSTTTRRAWVFIPVLLLLATHPKRGLLEVRKSIGCGREARHSPRWDDTLPFTTLPRRRLLLFRRRSQGRDHQERRRKQRRRRGRRRNTTRHHVAWLFPCRRGGGGRGVAHAFAWRLRGRGERNASVRRVFHRCRKKRCVCLLFFLLVTPVTRLDTRKAPWPCRQRRGHFFFRLSRSWKSIEGFGILSFRGEVLQFFFLLYQRLSHRRG